MINCLIMHIYVPLVAPQMDVRPKLTTPATEDMSTMFPEPEAFNKGCASCERWKADSRFVAMINENSSDVHSVVGFNTPVPTLFTCIDPNKPNTTWFGSC